MHNFTFYAPTQVRFGRGVVSGLGACLAEAGISNVLLVMGGGSIKRNGVYDQITASLKAADICWEEYWGVKPNPSLEQVEAGIQIAREKDIQSIVGIGGGSVLDCSKAIAAGVYLDDYWAQVETRKPAIRALPVYTVLTLSGTGSEMNEKAVITNEAEAKKWSLSGSCMCPKVSFIDPEFQQNLPWHLTATGGIDAMTHVLENYFRAQTVREGSAYFAQETTLQLNEGLLRSLAYSLNELQHDERNYAVRANLAWAACWGLNGLSVAGLDGGDWTSHALEHALSGKFPHIPHGEGLAVLFPSWMEQVYTHAPDAFTRYAKQVWNKNTAEEGIQATRDAFSAWGAPDNLSHWGVTQDDVPEMVRNAFAYRALGKVVPLTEKDVTEIFMRVL